MKPILFYDPLPSAHLYLSRMYFDPMSRWLLDLGKPYIQIDHLAMAKDSVVLLLSDYLTPAAINLLKNNNNKIVGFNVTDSCYVSGACRFQLQDIDLMFMLSGLQKVNTSTDITVDSQFRIILKPLQFLPEEHWLIFDQMRQSGRLQSLPYVHWDRQPDIPFRAERERQTTLIRGGGHMRRILLALHLLKAGLLDNHSGFFLSDYFSEEMVEQFKFCDPCRASFKSNNGWFNGKFSRDLSECKSPARQDDPVRPFTLDNLGHWNNRCPASFYWLAEHFSRHHGPIDLEEWERMLNAKMLHPRIGLDYLSQAAFTSDFKWPLSIYAPQRFWEGAMIGTVNILPRFTNDQDYWPPMADGEHYLTYHEDFSEIERDFAINDESRRFIAQSALHLYDGWVRPGQYDLNERLIRHIFTAIAQHT